MAYMPLNPMLTDQRLMMFPNQTPQPEYSIDKLLSEERPIAELLEKLSRILLRTQDVPQTLYGYMVPLCAKIFGKTGLLHSRMSPRDRDAIYCFLEPTGPLVRAAIRLTNERWVFDVVSDKLPRQTRLLLDPRLVSALPRVYEGRWELAAENSPLPQQVPTNYWNYENLAGGVMTGGSPVSPGNFMLGTSRSGEELRARIKFNMFEYYMFCFGLALVGDATTMRQPINDAGSNNSKERMAKSGYGTSAKATFTTASYLSPQQCTPDPVYFELLESYLHYFFPLQQTPDNHGSHYGGDRTSQSPRRRFLVSSDDERGNSTGLSSVSPTKRLRTLSRAAEGILGRGTDRGAGEDVMQRGKRGKVYLFIDRPLNLGVETTLAVAEFTVGILIDQWMNQNDYLPGDGYRIRPTAPYIQPSSELVQAITQLVSHLGKTDMRERAEDATLAGEASRYENSTGETTSTARIAKSNAYRTLQPRLYRFLRLAMDRWPADGTFDQVIKLWLTYISPWKHIKPLPVGEKDGVLVTEEWYPFIQQNFLFYAGLLPVFLERAVSFELLDTLEAAVASGDTRRRAGLISNLAAKKWAKDRLYLNEHTFMLEQVVTVFQEEGIIQALKDAEAAYLSTAGHNMHLNPLSMKSQSTPISKGVRRSGKNVMNGSAIAEWMEQIEGNGFLYKAFFTSQDKTSPQRIMGNICQAYDIKAVLRRELMPVDGWVKSTFNWLKDQLNGNSVQLAVDQLQMHEKYLLELAGKVQHVFELPLQDLHAYEHPEPNMSAYALEQLWAPETEPGHPDRLTARGRTQVKQGLRKFSPLAALDVKAQGKSANFFIKSYEFKFLVDLLRQLSDVLNIWWFWFLDHYVQNTFPTVASTARSYPINLRWLASYYNQVYLVIGCFMLYIGWSMLWLMFVGAGSNKNQIRRGAHPPIYR